MASDPDPSESSLPKDLKESLGKRYKKISYEKEIREWLRISEEYFVRWIKVRKEKLNNIDKVKNYYSALVQYLFYVDSMFKENSEEINIMIDNINKALGIEKATDSFEEVKRYIEPTRDFLSKLENYFVSVVLEQLRKAPNPVDCQAKDRKKVEFAIPYKNGQKFLGVANVDPIDDDAYWFAIGKAEEKNCAILWEDGRAIDDNKTIIESFENAFENGLNAKKVNKVDARDFDAYHTYSDTDSYPYWKYCSSIKNLIGEIKKFVQYINAESEAN